MADRCRHGMREGECEVWCQDWSDDDPSKLMEIVVSQNAVLRAEIATLRGLLSGLTCIKCGERLTTEDGNTE